MNLAAFDDSYASSRDAFCQALAAAGGRHERLTLGGHDPGGAPLSIDLGLLGDPAAERWVLHFSGVHGIEGFVGSAIQQRILEQWRTPPGVAVLLVHAVNPFGMAWLRRWNEHNVDLNRNFLAPGEKYVGAHVHYAALDGLINPPSPPTWLDTFYLEAAWQILCHGFNPLKQALAEGQYEYPRGLFFGGRELEPGPAALFARLGELLRPARRAVVIDVHTGLGPWGVDSLLVDEPAGSPVYRELRAAFGERIEVSEFDGTAYRARGTLLTGLVAHFSAIEWRCVCQEFGTYSGLAMLKALRDENRVHHYGDPADLNHPAKIHLRESFVPAHRQWREGVLERGAALFGAACELAAG